MRPLKENVLVKQDDVITKSTGGILINIMELRQQKPERGKVICVGKNCKQVTAGDYVTFGKFAGINVELDDEEYILFAENELDAIIR